MGWQSPFATETAGLFKAGNSVASVERTSAALKLYKIANPNYPKPRSSAPFTRAYLRELYYNATMPARDKPRLVNNQHN